MIILITMEREEKMRLYNVTIRYKDDGETGGTVFACLKSKREEELYNSEKYGELFANTGYCDDDIAYYVMPDEKLIKGYDAGFAVVESVCA